MKHFLSLFLSTLLLVAAAGCGRESDAVAGEEGIRLEYSVDSTAAITPLSVAVADGLLRPEQSMKALRDMTRDGKIIRRGWPVSYEAAEWAAAAWEVYCATGSDDWLREAYAVIIATLRAEKSVSFTADGLLKGIDRRLEPMYPAWSSTSERIESLSLWINAFHYRSLEVAALMADTLGRPGANSLREQAAQVRAAINNQFWIAPQSRYAAFLYSPYYPIPAPISDIAADAVCSLTGIATPEMTDGMLHSTPCLEGGYPDFYPLISEPSAANATTAALIGLAAAKARKSAPLTSCIKGLGHCNEASALLLKGIYGWHLTPEGIEVAPFVPENVTPISHINGFHYRRAVIDISLHGSGDRIASFKIDSVACRPFIPASLEGRHKVEIVMANNTLQQSDVSRLGIDEAVRIPTAPTSEYNVYINGVFDGRSPQAATQLPEKGLVYDFCPLNSDETEGFSALPLINPESYISVTASSITPRRPPLNLIKDRETASQYIELAPRHNTRLTFYANIHEAGDYAVRIVYSNGSESAALRTLGVMNQDGVDIPVGVLICAPVRKADWVTTAESTNVAVTLTEGLNRLSLTYVSGTILFNRIDFFKLK